MPPDAPPPETPSIAAPASDAAASDPIAGSSNWGRWVQGAVGAAIGIATLTAFSRVVGFGRTIVFARTVGATCLGDTYVTANTVPNLMFEIVAGGALASLVVPVLSGAAARGDRDEAGRTASALVSWSVLIAVPLMVIGLLLARPLVSLFVGGGSAGCSRHDEIVVGTRMLQVFMPQVVFYILGVMLTGIVQAHRRFLAPATGPIVSSALVIGVYLWFGARHEGTDLAQVTVTGQLILAVGTTLGVVALVAPLAWPVTRLHLRWRPTLRFPASVGRRVAGLAVAGVATLAAQQVSVGVVLRLAHGGDGGTLVLYNLAWTMFLLPWAVLAVPVATSAFPRLAAHAERGDGAAFAAVSAPTVRVVVAVSLIAAGALAAAAAPIARVLVLRVPGNGDTTALAWALVAFAPGLVGYGLVAAVGRILYARSEWRLAALAICSGWLLVIAGDVALVRGFAPRWRVVALALGNSTGMLVAGALLIAVLVRRAGSAAAGGVARTGVAGAGGAVVGGLAGGVVVAALGRAGVVASAGIAVLSAAVAGAAAAGVIWFGEPPAERRRLVALAWRRP